MRREEATERFPLYFTDDPHWNARGARFAAETVGRALHERGLIPCDVSE